ncbi:hypothetical protein RI129_002455 [Pyrocoelia pectoralis]|uniref:Single domain-containing protein n=1 Tax=Pyrocoelia pectoralis TaxID=417401 RepID=A0AAN7VMQ5_9COLE
MSSLMFSVIVTILILGFVYSWSAIEQTDNSQSHKGYCYSKIKGVGEMRKGEIKMKIGECVKVECTEGGLMVHTGCNPVKNDCNFLPNLTKFYPDCCPEVLCKASVNNTYT